MSPRAAKTLPQPATKFSIEPDGPGQDLDEIIASHVLGWRKTSESVWVTAQGNGFPTRLAAFSTDLNAAWRAVEAVEAAIKERGNEDMDFLDLSSYGEGEYMASFGEYYWAKSATPAHAICLACLEVMDGIEKENKSTN